LRRLAEIMSTMEYVKPLTYYGALIAIIVGFVGLGFSILTLSFISVVLYIIAVIAGFLILRRYYPLVEKTPREIAVWLIVFGILSWAAIGGILVFIAGLLVLIEKEGEAA
jgi:hypothetical protein